MYGPPPDWQEWKQIETDVEAIRDWWSCPVQRLPYSLFFSETKVFSSAEQPLSPCFDTPSRGTIHSLGAGWAFLFQPMLPPDLRPAVPFQRVERGPGD